MEIYRKCKLNVAEVVCKFNKTFVFTTKNVKAPDKFLRRDVNEGVL